MQTPSYQVSLPLLSDADTEARALGHAFVSPEHLLLAVARAKQGASDAFFARHGLTADTLRESVATILGQPDRREPDDAPRTLAHRSFLALGQAIEAGHRRRAADGFTADDLLLSLLQDNVADHAVVGAVLLQAGLSPAAARAELATGNGPV